MNVVYITTENDAKASEACREIESSEGSIGPSIITITGSAGRGKSEFAKHHATNGDAIYIPPMNIRTPTMVLREITFELCKARPGHSETCLNLIGDELAKKRRLVIIDEADLLSISILEMLRNMNERYNCPIVLIGEDNLRSKIANRRRISSRIRRNVEFLPITQADIVLFFRKALDINISPQVAACIHQYSKGDWRPVLTTAISIERATKASGLDEISTKLVRGIIHEDF